MAELIAHQVHVLADHALPILGVELGVERHAAVVLVLVEDVFEMMVLDAEHDVRIHLDEAAIAVIGEARIARQLGQARDGLVVEPEIEHRVHHAGHRGASTRAHRDQQRLLGRAELGADRTLDRGQGGRDLVLQRIGIAPVVAVIIGADLGRDREARRHRQAEMAHLGQIGALAAQEIAHVRAPLGLAVAEAIHPLGGHGACHRRRFPRSPKSRRLPRMCRGYRSTASNGSAAGPFPGS